MGRVVAMLRDLREAFIPVMESMPQCKIYGHLFLGVMVAFPAHLALAYEYRHFAP